MEMKRKAKQSKEKKCKEIIKKARYPNWEMEGVARPDLL